MCMMSINIDIYSGKKKQFRENKQIFKLSTRIELIETRENRNCEL